MRGHRGLSIMQRSKINTISKMRGGEGQLFCFVLRFVFCFLISLIKITVKLCNSERICYINMCSVKVMHV